MYRFIIPLFIVVANYAFAQPSDIEEQSIDSILSWMQSNYTLDSMIFQDIAVRTIIRAEKESSTETIAELHLGLADWHGYTGLTNSDSLLRHMYKALNYYQELGNQEKIASINATLSIDLLNANKLEESQASAFKAIELYEKMEDKSGLANCYRSLSYLFFKMEQVQKSVDYGLLAIERYEEVEDYDRISYTLLQLIESYQSLKLYDKAQEAAQRCIDIVYDKVPNQVFVLGRAYSRKGEVSLLQGMLDQALEEGIKSYDIVRKEVGDDRAGTYRVGIGDVYFAQGKWEEALPHFLASVDAMDRQETEHVGEVYKKVSDTYKQLGDYQNSLSYHERFSKAEIEKRDLTIANLETETVIKYETGKKDEALANQEQALRIKSRNQKIYLGIMTLLAGLLAGLFFLYRKTKEVTKALNLQIVENEVLMKEIHHRVKNNLQILSSLLSLQSDDEENEKIAGALQESRNRVQSMGLIHQTLYSKDNLTSINISEYVNSLCDHLESSFHQENKNLRIERDIRISSVDVDTAIPLGLIINELVTNSIKYAFTHNDDGVIQVSLNEGNGLILRVSDNGEVSKHKDVSSGTQFGSKLIDILCKKLKGTLTIDRSEGYSTEINFERYKLA